MFWLKCGVAVIRQIVAWVMLAARVEQMLKNHLPHIERRIEKVETKLDEQIDYCRATTGRDRKCLDPES